MVEATESPMVGNSGTNGVGDEERGLHLRGVSKTFPSVKALDNVDLDVRAGSVHALLGHNGCGKSTLVKSLAGFHAPDEGTGTIDGQELILGSAIDADRAGIRFVHQELGLINELSAVDNVGFVLGHEHGPLRSISWRKQAAKTQELLSEFGIEIDPMAPLSEASPVARTAVAIVRAVAGWTKGRGLLVLDEPTAALPAREVEDLFRLIREVADSGTAVLLISHRLDEVMQVCDHATVMRSGKVIWDGRTADMSVREFAKLIAGSENLELEQATRPPIDPGAETVLKVKNLSGRFLNGVDLEVKRGEIVGIAGLLGSGREELPYIVAGAESEGVTGTIEIEGKPLRKQTVEAATKQGVVLVPADRAREGVFAEFTVRENVTLAALPTLRSGMTLMPSKDRGSGGRWLEAVKADPKVAEQPITTLSGGNQQKAVIARWLSVDPKLLTLSEPTAGIDIGARTTIYEEIRRRADEGLSVLIASSDAEDLLAVCDRVIVLRDGDIVAEISRTKLSKKAVVIAMEGAHGEEDE
jgi:ribose transport system ATP-binding protein